MNLLAQVRRAHCEVITEERHLRQSVRAAHQAGHTWDEIGAALSTTGKLARIAYEDAAVLTKEGEHH